MNIDGIFLFVALLLWLLPFVILYQIHRNTLRTAAATERAVVALESMHVMIAHALTPRAPSAPTAPPRP